MESRLNRIDLPRVAAMVALFLAPVIGGQVSADARPLPPGGFFAGMMGGSELPMAARALLGLLLATALGVALFKRRIVQHPNIRVLFLLLGVLILFGASIAWSSFTWMSVRAYSNWLLLGMAFFVVVVTGGRDASRPYTWAIVAGTTITAVKGILEYAAVRASEPSYRIFADWINPNALAGILVVAVPLALSLAATGSRVERLLASSSAGLIVFALLLTQSKGGWAALAVALVIFAVASFCWRTPKTAAWTAVPLVVGALLFLGLRASSPAASGSAMGRITDANSTAGQSSTYRVLLWKSAIDLAERRLLGNGVGTFHPESSRPGLVIQTVHAHQTWLEIASDVGFPGLLLALGLAFRWIWQATRGATKLSHERAAMLAGAVAAALGAAADGMVETVSICAGAMVIVGAVGGLALQSAADGSNPEPTPRLIRFGFIGLGCVLPVILLFCTATNEFAKAQALSEPDPAAGLSLARAASFGFDGEVPYMESRLVPGSGRAVFEAVRLSPNTRVLRAAAAYDLAHKNLPGAISHLERALARDPNNLPALAILMDIYVEQGNRKSAIAAAERLVSVESKAYFQIRAIPEIVPLETYRARLFLAKEGIEEEGNLRAALAGFRDFRERTVPQVVRFVNGGQRDFLGITMEEAADAMADANQASLALERLLRVQRRFSEADTIAADRSVFDLP